MDLKKMLQVACASMKRMHIQMNRRLIIDRRQNIFFKLHVCKVQDYK